ncbi:MAG: hypothetical protein JWO89_2402 [Verrucomicrobiaceae bacterium]|nr:hypothetical protein [Verrucomicrobiaceae bacterium]
MTRRSLITLVALILPLASCKDMTAGKSLAQAAILDFHAKFNDSKFKEIYAASSPDMKKASSEADFVKFVETVHRKLGKHTKATDAGWKVNSFNFKTSAIISQNSEFEQGKGVETFTYLISGNSCTLQGYHINSQDMMMK